MRADRSVQIRLPTQNRGRVLRIAASAFQLRPVCYNNHYFKVARFGNGGDPYSYRWRNIVSGQLVQLARFHSSQEASIARSRLDADGIRSELSGEAMAGWFWHFGSAIGGVGLLVNEEDVQRASDILGESDAISDTPDIDFGDDSTDERDDVDARQLPGDLIRAWRASIIGIFLLPPILNLYSMWLLLRNRLFRNQCSNWRVPASTLVNVAVLGFISYVIFLMASLSSDPPYVPLTDPTGKPVEPFKHTETYTFPIVP